MRLLILGGTRFLGRHLAAIAIARGHAVTLLHRGRSGGGLFPEAEHLIADRDGPLDLLGLLGDRRRWDAAIDTSAYVPRQVRAVAQKLAGRIGHYQLVSSISVYQDFSRAGIDETAATVELADPDIETINGETYGGLKRLCERAALAAFDARCAIVRPGLIVGPHDPTERFTWWLRRIALGGEVLAPGSPQAPVQFIDARDLAGWMLGLAERGAAGLWQASGPMAPLNFGELLRAIAQGLAPAGTTFTWVDADWLLQRPVAPWSELPLWLPAAVQGMLQIDLTQARVQGLRCRPLAETIRDTAAWAAAAAPPAPPEGPARPATGLAPQREADLLRDWQLARRFDPPGGTQAFQQR